MAEQQAQAQQAEPTFRLAAAADLHCRSDQHGRFRELVRMVNGEAEGLVIAGDLTDHGTLDEAKTLAEVLSQLRVPCAAVLGNHDYEGGVVRDICRVLTEAKVTLLDGDHAVFDRRLGIAGVKGFAGGFERGMLQAFGEPAIKAFVQEAVNEALKLEAALAQLEIQKKVVVMHYAPVFETTEGEDLQLRPFLGSSRLLGPCEAFGARAVFHGHSHHGTLEARTPKGVPVYNVAMPLLRKHMDDRRFRVFEL
ncbi:metallophosphoesterase [Anaeromyxobacter sp. PSR-1]|uniref:metallophosphoesterase family protein n=1 Tax=unclassified Anaeromyxobacter TaxID=2620896 RepID=UPI0009E1FC8F|nr:metallophosphoesterase [Anaeromyxobacter sp. PSR-1]